MLGRVSPNRRSPYVGVIFSTVLALALIFYVANQAESDIVLNLASTTALLLLAVFTVVNIACLVLRRDGRESRFRSPGITPAIAALLTGYLLGPWADRDRIVYEIAAGLLVIGVVLWLITWLTNRGIRAKKTGFRDIEHMDE